MENTQVLEVLKTHSYPKGYAHTVYIDEDVDEPVYYRNVINTLDTAQEGDSVRMIISTGGGLLATANMITYAMDCCKAEITAVLTSSCMSAGTIIALHAHKWEIGAGLDWMVHSGSFGVGGETHSVRKYHDHNQRIMRELLDREYTGFYSPKEIDAIANGDDSLLVAQEVGERLDTFAKHRMDKEETYHQELEDSLWEQNNIMVSEAISSLDISQSDKDTFNRVKDLLDKEMMMAPPEVESTDNCCSSPEETPLSDFPSVIEPIYAWTGDISVEAFNYPEDALFLFDASVGIELDITLSSMINQREEVIHFLTEVTGKQPYHKKSTKTLALELIALATKFIIEVEK